MAKYHILTTTILLVVLLTTWTRACAPKAAEVGGPPDSTSSTSSTTPSQTVVPPRHIYAQYPAAGNPLTLNLSHLVVDHITGRVYVAGVNRLIQLDAALRKEITVVTGPLDDNPLCQASGCNSPLIQKFLTDNVNKVLLLEPKSRTLIVCGSLFQGACEKYKVSDISQSPKFFPRGIVANDESSSTYAFIGPESYNCRSRSNVLYVGTTFTTNGDYRHGVPAISTRNLLSLEFAKSQSFVDFDVRFRETFFVKYVYGFNDREFAYFVILQKQSYFVHIEENSYVSRLARTCIDDEYYHTYTEMTLQCTSRDGRINYNLIQDAKVIRAGTELGLSLGLEPDEPILVGVFSPSRSFTNESQPSSAMCVYSLQDIEAMFNENIHMCLNGSIMYRNMIYISWPINNGMCPRRITKVKHVCDAGLKISGVVPIVSKAVIEFPGTSISSITMGTTKRDTVTAFLGTRDGRLKKVMLSNESLATEYEEVIVDPGYPLLPDTTLDRSGDFLYVLTTSKVLKVKVAHCSNVSNCSSCFKDPYCD